MYINYTNYNITDQQPTYINASNMEMLVFFFMICFISILLFFWCRDAYRKDKENKRHLNVFTGKIVHK